MVGVVTSHDYRTISAEPLAPSVGAEIHGIDLSRSISEESVRDIRQALGEHGVIIFRDQTLSPADHLAFARRFGPISINRFFHPVDGFPEIANVRRQPDERGATGWYWHTDHSYDRIPALGSIFVARDLPPVGGDTLFAGMVAAYDALSDGLKAVLEGLEAWHSTSQSPEVGDPDLQTNFGDRLKSLDAGAVRSKHPVVIRHPISNKKVLYVNSGFTEGIDGWTRPESEALLKFLYDHATQPLFTYRHRWQDGDVAFWDNRATWHCALDDCFGHRRVLHRITIEGEPLVPARP